MGSMGKVKVESIDDNEEMQIMDEAFDILGFTFGEKTDVYKISALCMHASRLEFTGMGEVASPKNLDAGEVLNDVLHFAETGEAMYDAFINPKYKVGTEWVNKTQNVNACVVGTGSIIKNIYGRLFRYLVDMCNSTLCDPTMKKVNFIGVLDIAGFEIFEFNTFEQICINFVNEKLQQFFNHHMFVLEQEEYMREGIDWVMVDFGMDLAAAIIMFEKPMGIWAILEEESLFPKATDKSFEEKLKASLGKLPVFLKPQSKTDKNAHFGVSHYAGVVNYNVTSWLGKNKDPVNETVGELFKSTSTCQLLVHLWRDHPGQPTKDDGKKKKKGGGGKTVSSVYLVSLSEL